MSCDCTGCCSSNFEDFPETIYVRVTAPVGLDIYAPMTRKLVPVIGGCCKNLLCYSGVQYETKMMSYRLPPAGHPVCCFSVHLYGTCEGSGNTGDCVWQWAIEETDAELDYANWPDYEPISLGCKVEGGAVTTKSLPSLCMPTIVGNLLITITFSETEFGSPSVATGDCVPQCCETPPETLYLTLSSDCPEINGAVIELQLSGAHVEVPFTDYGQIPVGESAADGPPDRAIVLTWDGSLKLCNCTIVYFSVTHTTYTHPNVPPDDTCIWTLGANQCIEADTQKGGEDTHFCVTVEFTGVLAGGCPLCCTDAEGFAYTAELTE